MITIEQIKAARVLLNWKQTDLADAVGMSSTSIANIERKAVDPRSSSLRSIQEVLEKAGIEFVFGRDGEIGVLLRKRASNSSKK